MDGPPPPRARLAILKLCRGSVERVLSMVAEARLDFRDIVAAAEYPDQGLELLAAKLPGATDADRERFEEAKKRDRQHYEEWLKKCTRGRSRLTWCCSGRSSFLASLGRMLAAEHQDVRQTRRSMGVEGRGEPVAEGTWLYDGNVRCRIVIVYRAVRYGTGDAEDPPGIAADSAVDTYEPWYELPGEPGRFGAGGGQYSTLLEAQAAVEALCGRSVEWDSRRAT
jgi:hypothetical protein